MAPQTGKGGAAAAAQPVRQPAAAPGILGYLREAASVDVRSLALFRVALGVIILCDLAVRASDMRMFYTDQGVLPRSAVLEKFAHPAVISVHLMGGTLFSQIILFVLATIAALALLAGYKSRTAAFVSWFLLISLQTRNPAVLQGGDVLLRILLFWAIFLPIGDWFSVDSALNTSKEPRSMQVFSVASVALLIQAAMLYSFAALAKTGAEWRHDGTALYYALNIDQMCTWFGQLLRRAPLGLLRFMTFSVFLFEGFGPFLLLFSIRALRTIMVLAFVLLPLGFGSSLKIGLFPFVCATAVLGLLPSTFWERLRLRGREQLGAPFTIYYDGECSFCKRSVFLLKNFFSLHSSRILAAQSDPQRLQEMKKHRSWIVEDSSGEHLYSWQAFLVLMRHSAAFFLVGKTLSWKPLMRAGEWVYGRVERNRTFLSRITEGLQFRPMGPRMGWVGQSVAALLLIYIVWWNLGNEFSDFEMPMRLRTLAFLARVDQGWDMFAPYPLKDDGWYVIPGKLKNGQPVDLWNWRAGEASWDKPADVAGMYPNERWRKYFMNLYLKKNTDYRLYYGQYVCREWNNNPDLQPGQELATFDIYFMMKTNQPPGNAPVMSKQMLWTHHCY